MSESGTSLLEIPKTKQGNAPMGGARAVPGVFAAIWPLQEIRSWEILRHSA